MGIITFAAIAFFMRFGQRRPARVGCQENENIKILADKDEKDEAGKEPVKNIVTYLTHPDAYCLLAPNCYSLQRFNAKYLDQTSG